MRNNKITANNYVHRQKKKEDKYDGLFSKKQLQDLDGGIGDLEIEVVSKKKLEEMKKQQSIQGCGSTMHSPFMPWEQ